MAIKLTCPKCKSSFSVQAERGTRIQCPSCSAKLRLPGRDEGPPRREASSPFATPEGRKLLQHSLDCARRLIPLFCTSRLKFWVRGREEGYAKFVKMYRETPVLVPFLMEEAFQADRPGECAMDDLREFMKGLPSETFSEIDAIARDSDGAYVWRILEYEPKEGAQWSTYFAALIHPYERIRDEVANRLCFRSPKSHYLFDVAKQLLPVVRQSLQLSPTYGVVRLIHKLGCTLSIEDQIDVAVGLQKRYEEGGSVDQMVALRDEMAKEKAKGDGRILTARALLKEIAAGRYGARCRKFLRGIEKFEREVKASHMDVARRMTP